MNEWKTAPNTMQKTRNFKRFKTVTCKDESVLYFNSEETVLELRQEVSD